MINTSFNKCPNPPCNSRANTPIPESKDTVAIKLPSPMVSTESVNISLVTNLGTPTDTPNFNVKKELEFPFTDAGMANNIHRWLDESAKARLVKK